MCNNDVQSCYLTELRSHLPNATLHEWKQRTFQCKGIVNRQLKVRGYVTRKKVKKKFCNFFGKQLDYQGELRWVPKCSPQTKIPFFPSFEGKHCKGTDGTVIYEVVLFKRYEENSFPIEQSTFPV